MGRQLLGKIRSMDKREYTLYDDGDKKERKELGFCKVTTAGATKPITLEAKVKVDQGALLVESYDLETVQPKYNKDKGSYYLPFERVGERVTMNSRHNFLRGRSPCRLERSRRVCSRWTSATRSPPCTHSSSCFATSRNELGRADGRTDGAAITSKRIMTSLADDPLR